MRRFNSINERLVFASENKTNQVLDSFETNKMGITNETVKHHSDEFGKNIITKQKKDSILKKIFNAFINPFTAILKGSNYSNHYCSYGNDIWNITLYSRTKKWECSREADCNDFKYYKY